MNFRKITPPTSLPSKTFSALGLHSSRLLLGLRPWQLQYLLAVGRQRGWMVRQILLGWTVSLVMDRLFGSRRARRKLSRRSTLRTLKGAWVVMVSSLASTVFPNSDPGAHTRCAFSFFYFICFSHSFLFLWLVSLFFLDHLNPTLHYLLYERWHRRFWQTSVDHRGTPAKPGRVCTILPATHPDLVGEGEGSTAGMVYEIADIDALLPELDFREKNGYTRTVVPYYLKQDDDEPAGKAILYFAQQGDDPAYTGPAPVEETAAIIARSVGSVQLQLLPTHVFGFVVLFFVFFLLGGVEGRALLSNVC